MRTSTSDGSKTGGGSQWRTEAADGALPSFYSHQAQTKRVLSSCLPGSDATTATGLSHSIVSSGTSFQGHRQRGPYGPSTSRIEPCLDSPAEAAGKISYLLGKVWWVGKSLQLSSSKNPKLLNLDFGMGDSGRSYPWERRSRGRQMLGGQNSI